jgi:hypothetical protein
VLGLRRVLLALRRRLLAFRRPSVLRATLLALLAVLPLLVPELWAGFRLGLSDAALSVIAPTEQPLSVRSPIGPWIMALTLAWFGLAYRRRKKIGLWEAALVLAGGVAALARMGNAWVDAAAMVVPLARQLSIANFKPALLAGLAALCLAVGLTTVAISRPPDLPGPARQAALSAPPRGTVLADWRWAGDLQRRIGITRVVWAADGLTAESADFWLDYLRLAQGHERWSAVLHQLDVDLVVLDAAGQQRQAADLVRASSDWRVIFDANGVLVAERVDA